MRSPTHGLFILLQLIIGLSIIGCSPMTKIPAALAPKEAISIPFSVTAISLLDSRPDTASAEMKLPLISARQREWIIKPGITESQKQQAFLQIQNASREDRLQTHAVLEILDGYYKVEGNSHSVSEHTHFRCKLHLIDPATGNTWFAIAETSYVHQTINATEKHAKMLYEATILKCVSVALQYLAETPPPLCLRAGCRRGV
ncbi:hypothetical protein [Cesiribacter andamanensis]|uniref:Lipoprotein n=1 Tax=Cesiribacter andamanensis AMV16 TaxID=1279009 RepID=M7NYF5_9BACT|nr:hypothetical protein [Cesiribacter andamanensis]EMR03419.1 hypothetical protein ADICEAN_01441 [Cesiribacter andamanensis AMV16]